MAHTVVALAWGIPVRDITLHLFGGMSSLEREPPTPKSEFWMAIVGPIVSLVVGVVLLLAGSLVVSVTSAPAEYTTPAVLREIGPFATVVLWLASANILVAIFNLLPGFPLDGGRVLRSAVWAATGNLRKATRVATLSGQILGWTLVMLGLFMAFGGHVPLFGTGLAPGLWTALIGWVLRTAAIQSYRGAVLEEVLQGHRAADVMRRDGPWVPADLNVGDLVDHFLMRSEERAYPVFDGARFVGLVAFTDVRRVSSNDRRSTTVAQIMTSRDRLTAIQPDEELIDALRKMRRADVAQLPVVVGDRLDGMLFERDIARFIELNAGAEPPVAGRRTAPVPG
jgi:Zn-dependent protease